MFLPGFLFLYEKTWSSKYSIYLGTIPLTHFDEYLCEPNRPKIKGLFIPVVLDYERLVRPSIQVSRYCFRVE